MEVASGRVIGRTYRPHRHQEVLRFLREVDKAVLAEQEIHIVLDNYATHSTRRCWTGSSAGSASSCTSRRPAPSWASLVERFFATLTDKQVRRGVFTSVPNLEKCLRKYLKRHNENPQMLVWTKPLS